MPKSQAYSLASLKHYFQNVSIPNVGDVTGLPAAATAGSLYVALHTADPGKTGDQTTSEATYTGYARVGVVRSTGQWSVAGTPIPLAQNINAVNFAACTGGSNIIGWFSVGVASSGASQIGYSGMLAATLFDGASDTAENIIQVPSHTFVVGDTIVFVTDNNETLPGGVTAGTIYFVKTVAGNDLTIAATLGGAAITITTDAPCTVGKIVTLTVSNGVTPSFATNAITCSED